MIVNSGMPREVRTVFGKVPGWDEQVGMVLEYVCMERRYCWIEGVIGSARQAGIAQGKADSLDKALKVTQK